MREIIRHYGAENCFFGVDFPMWDHEEELERFFALSLTDYENRRKFDRMDSSDKQKVTQNKRHQKNN